MAHPNPDRNRPAGPPPSEAFAQQAHVLIDMIGPVSHELHNVFNSIALQAALLGRGVPEEWREKVAAFRTYAFRASELLGVLDRYRHGLRRPLVLVPINEVVESAVACCREEGLAVDWRPGARVPEVLADAEDLGRLVGLLVRNARAAMDSADPVAVQTGRQKGQVVLTVKDSGPRVKRDLLDSYFEPMAPARGAEEPLERVACWGLAERLRATIRANNVPGGLAVTVEFSPEAGTEE